MDNEKKPCCCCGTPAQPEAATAPAVDASAVPTESVTPSCCRHKDRTPEEHKALLNRLSRIEGQSCWPSTSPPAWRTTCARAARQNWTSW